MSRSLMKAKYTLTPVPNTDLVEIGITPKELARLTAKLTFWGMLPSILIVGGMIVVGTYLDHQEKKEDSENPVPETD